MSEMSDYLETALINGVIRATTYTAPATVYLALFTSDPLDDGSGTEVSGGSYAREIIAFGAPTDGVSTNSGIVTFTKATASWGVVSHFGIYDAVTVGNLLLHSIADTSKTVNIDDTAEFAIGDVSVTFA